MQRVVLFSVVKKKRKEKANEGKGRLPGAGGFSLGDCAVTPSQRAGAGRKMMLFPPSGAEQLLGSELLCSSFHQRKCQRSKLCCQMPHGHQMFPTGSHQPALPRHWGEGSASHFHPPALSSLSCCRPICPTSRWPRWAAYRLQTRRTGAGGCGGGPLATPEQRPFSSPFPSLQESSFVWDCRFVASQELQSMAKRHSFAISLQIKKTGPSPLRLKD